MFRTTAKRKAKTSQTAFGEIVRLTRSPAVVIGHAPRFHFMTPLHTDERPAGAAGLFPSTFKYTIVGAAFFIAGVSAYFSVQGLGLLFVGSSTAVMIMAASLEVGKLVAASFLYRYWDQINRAMKIYLVLAVLLLIAITSLGNYGYLARAYERTHTQIGLLEGQIAGLQKEINDTQHQIDGARGSVTKVSEAGREDIGKVQQRITAGSESLNQALARIQERRKTAQERRDRDLQVPVLRTAEQAEVLKKSIAAEEAALAGLNDRLAALDRAAGPAGTVEAAAIAALNDRVLVLDRAVDAYTKQGGPGFFKRDSIRKGQELREQQRPAREAISTELAAHRARIEQLRGGHEKQQQAAREAIAQELALHRARIEQLRGDHAKQAESADREITAVREQSTQETARLDAEEQDSRKTSSAGVAELEKQLAALQSQGQTTVSTGDTQAESLYQRIRTRNEDIHRLRGQIAAVDIGSYRFVARAFDATADDVVKWLMLALVLVFDPLAVSLVIGFNLVLLRDRPQSRSLATLGSGADGTVTADSSAPSSAAPRSRRMAWVVSLLLLAAILGAVALAGLWGRNKFRDQALASHGSLIPGGSFALMTLRPDDLSRSTQGKTFADWLGKAGGKTVSDSVAGLLTNGFDPAADVYVFAKFPAKAAAGKSDRPVMLCGIVARVSDPVAVEAALSRLADQVSTSLRTTSNAAPSLARNRLMIRHATGRYLDPEGGFFTFGLTGQSVIMLIEFEGNPQAPCVEDEIRRCLAQTGPVAGEAAEAAEQLPPRARSRDGAISLWFDSGRFCNHLPKNAASQARYQQLEKHLGFDLLLTVQRAADDQLNLVADYAYQSDRFKDRQQPTPLQVVAGLGPAETSGLGGRLMDRCLDTLDYDSLIERLRAALGGTNGASAQQVLIEKSFTSERAARFVLNARYDPQAGPPLIAAMQTLFQ